MRSLPRRVHLSRMHPRLTTSPSTNVDEAVSDRQRIVHRATSASQLMNVPRGTYPSQVRQKGCVGWATSGRGVLAVCERRALYRAEQCSPSQIWLAPRKPVAESFTQRKADCEHDMRLDRNRRPRACCGEHLCMINPRDSRCDRASF